MLGLLIERMDQLTEMVALIERRLSVLHEPAASPGVQEEPPGRIEAGALVIVHDARTAYVRGEALRLSPTEYKVLFELARTPGKVVLTAELMRRTRGAFSPDKSYLKVYVGRLRAKLSGAAGGQAPCNVETVRGVGYRLVV